MLACFKVRNLNLCDAWHFFAFETCATGSLSVLILSTQLRAFTDNRDDLSLGHVVVLLQYDWPQGEMLFLKAIEKICQQGSFQYENFFNYVTSILSPLDDAWR